jgi:rare lipoprotein A
MPVGDRSTTPGRPKTPRLGSPARRRRVHRRKHETSRSGRLIGELWHNDHTEMKSHDRCPACSHLTTVPPLLDSDPAACRISVDVGYNMSSTSHARTSYVDIKANPIHLKAPLVSAAGVRNMIQLFAVALGAASLAACAQSSVVSKKSESVAASRQASLEQHQRTSFVTKRRVAVTKKHTPFASNKSAAETQPESHGIASFYTEGTQTASGEKFDTRDLTAAHRTLPFGTRLRVTNVTTGQSVTVRVNDRGPFVPGRVVDVSHSAAETLGMVEGGIAKVKLDVVQ